MKKLTSLIIFVGLAINVSGQEEPKNLKEAFKADWLIGTWETKNDDGQVTSQTFGWKIQDVLMFKESKGSDGKVGSFAIISLDTDEGKVLMHYHSSRGRTSIEEVQFEGNKVIRTANWKSKKLSKEQIESRVESIVEGRLASGAVQEEGVAELKQNVRNFLNNRKTSGTNKTTYEKQGADKMVATSARKDESGQFVAIRRRGRGGSGPVTYTRKKE
jgi:hypothetical protein